MKTETIKIGTQVDQAREILRILKNAEESGLADSYSAKRRSTRFRVGLPFELTDDVSDPSNYRAVRIHNLSCGGFACWSKASYKPRTRVFLREFSDGAPGIWLAAIVRHCTGGISGHLIGASFEHPPAK